MKKTETTNASLPAGDELIFEVLGADGHAWRIYLDGRVEGFPTGAVVVNHAVALVDALIGEVKRKTQRVAAEQTDAASRE